MSGLPIRPILLAVTIVLSAIALIRFGVLVWVIVMMVGVTASVLAGRRRAGRFGRKRVRRTGPDWQPAVQHAELPAPSEDPAVGYPEPTVEQFASRMPPLAQLNLDGALRTQLDGFALGRAKRIMEAPDLLPHAAADPESWPVVELAVQQTLTVARQRGIEFLAEGLVRLQQALALSAAQGVLLAEWRQLDDGPTVWDGPAARVRASDAFAIQRITEAMERRLLPDLFAGISRRPPDFEVRLLIPYAFSTAFYLRLRGTPPAMAA
ncbi:MAG TPA: hypothetical protein VIT43_16255 [Candidatus Dormibacteraeota bacterium]